MVSYSIYPQERGATVVSTINQHPENRIALIIGNSGYKVAPLSNPGNDAQDMARALSQLGFEIINKDKMLNLTQKEMKEAIQAFGERIRNGGVGLFYFAGHGVQVKGENYLIPVDAIITKEEEIEYESVNVGFVLAQMVNAQNRLNILILDACRNNPFPRKFRSETRGLAYMAAPSGSLIAYATAPGSVASDGAGKNGLYTQELISSIRAPGLKIEDVFKLVRVAVQNKSGGQQIPWEASSLTGDFYFALPGLQPTSTVEAQKLEAVNYAEQGDKYLKDEKLGEAVKAFTQATKLDPYNATYFRKLGDSLSYIGQNDVSVNYYKQAILLEPKNIDAHVGLGEAYRSLKQYDKLLEEAEYVLRIDSNSWYGHELMWFYYSEAFKDSTKELAEKALAEAEHLVRIIPNSSRSYHHLGASYFSLGRYDDSIKSFRNAIRLEPKFYGFHEWIVDAYLIMGMRDKAIEEADSLQSVSPTWAKKLYDKIKDFKK
jgi:hypothetical protein